jgi:hypothetical protein
MFYLNKIMLLMMVVLVVMVMVAVKIIGKCMILKLNNTLAGHVVQYLVLDVGKKAAPLPPCRHLGGKGV